jgi:hypothetical protein
MYKNRKVRIKDTAVACFIMLVGHLMMLSHSMTDDSVGASHMSDNRQMSVAMQRLVDFISMVTNSTLIL